MFNYIIASETDSKKNHLNYLGSLKICNSLEIIQYKTKCTISRSCVECSIRSLLTLVSFHTYYILYFWL